MTKGGDKMRYTAYKGTGVTTGAQPECRHTVEGHIFDEDNYLEPVGVRPAQDEEEMYETIFQ